MIFSQASAGSKARYESRFVIDMPNAGVLPKETFAFNSLIQPNGITLVDFSYAPFTNVNVGLSFSANNVIGTGAIYSQKYPALNLKVRLIDETLSLPAIVLGFSNQGKGDYIKSIKRNQIISPGVYLAVSKNFKWAMGFIALHGGLNYSFDNYTDKNSPNLYFGIEQSLGTQFAFATEINTNLNEANNSISQSALLNIALRWSVSSNVTIELQLKDLMKNQIASKDYVRAFGFEYIGRF